MRIKKRWVKILLLLGVFAIGVEIAVVQIYDARFEASTPEGLVRESMETKTRWTVSYLTNENADDSLPRVVYVHGTPGSADAFTNYVRRPVPGLNPISIDRPGFGASTPRAPAVALVAQSISIEPFLVERNGQWPILVGHSMGGPIIARVAADFPDKVGGIVILSGALDPTLEKIYWYQRIGKFLFVPYMLPKSIRNSNDELYPLKGELELLKPMLKDVTCPVVIVHAPNDMLVPYANVDYMESQFKKDVIKSVVTLPEKNHFIPWNSESEIRVAIEQLHEAKNDLATISVDQNVGQP